MRNSLLLTIIGTICVPMLSADPAQAQATRTWVSGVGDDANPCSRTAPCKTFAGAISKTFINGEINCLDPGGFGAVTITRSITIDCHEIFASILASFTNGININIAAGNANDPLRTVRLRNLNINGTGPSGTVGTRTGLIGINIIAAQNVFVEDVLITDFTQFGIKDFRNSTGGLMIRNTVIRNNAGSGIGIAPAGVVVSVIDNTHSNVNNFGLAVGNGNKVIATRSVFMGNVTAGVEADPGGNVTVNESVISHNTTGISAGAGSTVRISNSHITFNSTGISGTTLSYGNNRILGNSEPGTAPTPAGAASGEFGQQ
jgi:hypothetical protein